MTSTGLMKRMDTLLTPYYEEDGITIYHGDCRDILPHLPKVDLVLTDPPYGVVFTGKVTKHSDSRGVREVYKDDDATWRSVVPAAINLALSIAKRGLIFPGIRRMQEYPLAKDIGGICCPNGGGISSWGFGCYHPVLFYGSSPLKGAHPTMKVIYHPGMHVTGEDWIDHPCPKPISFMRWAIERGSIQNETILDPFMGSGTTLRAAKDLGRKAIGIEIEEKYVKIAIERLRQEVLKL